MFIVKILNLLGLVISIVASLVFIIDSSRLFKALKAILLHLSDKVGIHDGPVDKIEINKLEIATNDSKKRNRLGFILFLCGFILQLAAAVIDVIGKSCI